MNRQPSHKTTAKPSPLASFFLGVGLLKQQIARPINGIPCAVFHLPEKRIFDLLFSVAVLLLLSPFFFLIGIIIALTSKGRVIYSHERIGRAGKPFQCLKFRSMYLDADARLEELLEKDAVSRREWKASHKLKNDPRITPFGQFIRKTSLDELPQFWNVVKGDLSVVGPRPVQKSEIIEHFGPHASKVLTIRPGLTGIWQTSGRSNTSYEERIEMDKDYIDTRTFWMDLKLIVKTIPAMLFSRGAY
jgi:exopolysaccharide production protein ExoY